MSTQALRARIVQLDTEIELQMEVLRKLRRDKSLVQCRLNEVVDPVARLPLEISSDIFLRCLPTVEGSEKPSAHIAPMLLLNVCHSWTAIAVATPTLWTTIDVDFPCPGGLTELLPIWFQRAGNRPLSISISLRGDSDNWDYGVSEIIWRNAERLIDLRIFDYGMDEDDEDGYSDGDEDEVDLFGDTTPPESLPMLETFTISGSWEPRPFFAPQILGLMRQAPRLIECNFDHLHLHPDGIRITSAPALPNLHRLKFASYSHITDSDILNFISLPALEALSLPNTVVNNSLLRCLKRSAPPLQELEMFLFYHSTDSVLQEFLHVVPSVIRFKIRVSDTKSPEVTNLFPSLADSSLLPNLHHLDIDMNLSLSDFPDSSWRTLLDAISTRRIELRVSTTITPPADILAACRKLVVDGRQISIGNKRLDFMAI